MKIGMHQNGCGLRSYLSLDLEKDDVISDVFVLRISDIITQINHYRKNIGVKYYVSCQEFARILTPASSLNTQQHPTPNQTQHSTSQHTAQHHTPYHTHHGRRRCASPDYYDRRVNTLPWPCRARINCRSSVCASSQKINLSS
jgi:hypothetical protein